MTWFKDVMRQDREVVCSRRQFLRAGSGFAASLLLPAAGFAKTQTEAIEAPGWKIEALVSSVRPTPP